ncbi:MAG: hypothetical protein HQ551_03130 [Desulfobacteraceae bacterium]|nr:hypothetical protein [Desulfobacteraceae bacterium]
MEKLDTEVLLKKYELTVQQEHNHYESYRTHVKFYVGLLGAVLAAGVVIVTRGPEQYHIAVFAALPVFFFLISWYAINAADTGYRRWLETVTTISKIEHLLGFTEEIGAADDNSAFKWSTEALVATRHLRDRNNYEKSEDFIQDRMRKGNHLWTVRLFRTFQVVSVIIVIISVFSYCYASLGSMPNNNERHPPNKTAEGGS